MKQEYYFIEMENLQKENQNYILFLFLSWYTIQELVFSETNLLLSKCAFL